MQSAQALRFEERVLAKLSLLEWALVIDTVASASAQVPFATPQTLCSNLHWSFYRSHPEVVEASHRKEIVQESVQARLRLQRWSPGRHALNVFNIALFARTLNENHLCWLEMNLLVDGVPEQRESFNARSLVG